jgi:flagellar motor switch protein FliN/FliY
MSDMLSQEEISALLGAADDELLAMAREAEDDAIMEEDADTEANESSNSSGISLTERQKDTLGEIGNISMGTAATTLSSLLRQKVVITTPTVKIMNWNQISDAYDRPCVGVKIDYTMGIKGSNILILKNSDVKIIADLMMGGVGDVGGSEELTEIDLSAIGEAMNQMIGSSSTSLASLVNERIDIATPKAFELDFLDTEFPSSLGFKDEEVVVTVFDLTIGELVDSEIMQVLPFSFAIELTNKLFPEPTEEDEVDMLPPPPSTSMVMPMPPPPPMPVPMPELPSQQEYVNNIVGGSNVQYDTMNQGMQQPVGYGYGQQPMPPPVGYAPVQPPYGSMQQQMQMQTNINAKPAQFQNFDMASVQQQKENIDILMDVPLEVTVELGKTSKRIKDILEFSPGTIIELDKLAGEPIDIQVNGKYVAKGEVVVIDENFGIRITSIISPEFRI